MRIMPAILFLAATATQLSLAQDTQAHILIYRARHFEGSALKPVVRLDGQPILKLVNGRFIALDVAPGEHVLTSDQEIPSLRVTLSPGEIIYVQGVIRSFRQFSNGRLELFKATPSDATEEIRHLKPVDQTTSLDPTRSALVESQSQ